MAVTDPTKKKRDDIPKIGVWTPDYGQTAPGGGGGAGSTGSTAPAVQPTGYAAGAAVNRVIRAPTTYNAMGESYRARGAAQETLAAPVRNFVRGLFGASPEAANAPPAPTTASAVPAGGGGGGSAPAPNRVSPAGSAATPGGALPAGGGTSAAQPARARRVIYNDGSGATYATGDGRVGQLPAGVAVVRQKDGTNAFGATGGSVAEATGATPTAAPVARTFAPVAAQTVQAPAPQAPAVAVRSLSGDVHGAEEERAGLNREIDNALLRTKPNSRGRRQYIADLLGLRRQLTGQRVDQATAFETAGAQQENAANIESAQLAQRTGEANANRTLDAARVNLDAQDRAATQQAVNQVVVDKNGTASLLRNDGTLMPLTGGDGKPFQPQEDPRVSRSVSPDAQYKVLSDRLTQLQQFGAPEGQEDSYSKEVADLQAKLSALEGGGSASASVPDAGSRKTGQIYDTPKGRLKWTGTGWVAP